MNHNLFKPKTFEEAKKMVVGDSNGILSAKRYAEETPVFARKILSLVNAPADRYPLIIDYGCGIGRLAKEILRQDDNITIKGVEPSIEMRELMENSFEPPHFACINPKNASIYNADIIIVVYVLQHVPAIELRETIRSIHSLVADNGLLFYCGSDVRMAIQYDTQAFCDDRFLGVDVQEELSRYFTLVGPAFTQEELDAAPVVKKMIEGKGGVPHPALIWRKKT